MAAKTTSKKPKRRNSRSDQGAVPTASAVAMASRNLINMVAITLVSGAVLLGLLAAMHF